MRKRTKGVIAACVGVALAVGGVALPANAAWNNGVVEPNEAAYYYSANETGALWDTDINTANYVVSLGVYPFNIAWFIGFGKAGNTALVQNDAHSLWNNKGTGGRSYYSVNYAGKSDYFSAYSAGNLSNTLNDNRSWKWS